MQRTAAVAVVIVLFASVAATGAAKTTFGEQSTVFPNLTAVEVYDVTGENAVGKETGGTLVASGINTTLVLDQLEQERQYRVTFAVDHDGSGLFNDWTLEQADPLYHTGLDPDWSVPTIWYNISGDQDYNGGNFSDGTVNWTTSNGGSVPQGETLYAKYLVNVTQDSSQEYTTTFWANDTSNSAGSRDVQTFDVNRIGSLSSTIFQPADGSIVKTNTTAPLKARFTCSGGECGEIVATPRYNASSASADTVMPSGSGTPFHTVGPAQQTCGTLQDGDSCNVTWSVNATGPVDTAYELDVNASSATFSGLPEENTTDRQVRLKRIVLFGLEFSTIDFGTISPGEQNVSALGNDAMAYNITVDDDSVAIDDFWIRATELTADADPSYTIGPSNISVNATIRPDPLRLRATYQHFAANIQPNSTFSTFYFLDVPTGIVQSAYSGTITFKANATV